MGRKKTQMTRHHRKCKINGGKNNARNISYVPQHTHRAWHCLFQDKEPHEIAQIINRDWLDPAYKMICVRRK